MKNFISVKDVSDISMLVKEAMAYKADPFKDKLLGGNKRIGLLFLNPSMRTRLSTQIAAQNLGMEADFGSNCQPLKDLNHLRSLRRERCLYPIKVVFVNAGRFSAFLRKDLLANKPTRSSGYQGPTPLSRDDVRSAIHQMSWCLATLPLGSLARSVVLAPSPRGPTEVLSRHLCISARPSI